MKKTFLNVKFFIIVFIFSAIGSFYDLTARLDFASRGSSIIIGESNSGIRINNRNNIYGWYQQSIVTSTGNDRTWVPAVPVTYGTVAGDTPASTHLLYTGSNSTLFIAEHFISDHSAILNVLGSISGETRVKGRGILASPIDLNGATLTNGGDILFSSKTTIASSGSLNARSYAYILGGDLTIPTGVDVKFTSSAIIDGQGHKWIFEGTSSLKLDPGVSLTFKNVTVENMQNLPGGLSRVYMMDQARRGEPLWKNTSITFEDSTVYFSREYSFTQGELYFKGDVKFTGTNRYCGFNYTSSHYARIGVDSTLMLDNGVSFSYGIIYPSMISEDNGRDLLKLVDQTSSLYLSGCTLLSTPTGLRLTNGILKVDHKNYLYNEEYFGAPGSVISEAIAFGNGTAANDLTIEILPGGSLDLVTGKLAYYNAS